MALSPNINDREMDKFEDVGGLTHVRTTATFSGGDINANPQGLTQGGLITEVALNSATWTALPPTPLPDRNCITIQNLSGISIKVNFDNTTVGFVGIQIGSGGERFYDIKDDIIIYAKSESGTPTVTVEELA